MTEQVNPTLETAEEAPKKKRTWLIVLIIIILLVLLCCVVAVASTLIFGGPAINEFWDQLQVTLTAIPAY